jgi:hypothetical protein
MGVNAIVCNREELALAQHLQFAGAEDSDRQVASNLPIWFHTGFTPELHSPIRRPAVGLNRSRDVRKTGVTMNRSGGTSSIGNYVMDLLKMIRISKSVDTPACRRYQGEW